MLLWNKIHLMPVCIKIRLPYTNTLLNIHHYVPNMYMYLLFWFDDQLFQTLINLYVNYMKPTLFIVYKQSVDVYSGIEVSPTIVCFLSSIVVTKQSAYKLSPPVFVCSCFILENFFLVSLQKTLHFFLS